jgi:glycosyltransferase involved in cell wall biosynthesis
MTSIIIPTFRNPNKWGRIGLLDALEKQTVPPVEVLICVDDPIDVADVDMIKAYAAGSAATRKSALRLFQRTATRDIDGGGPGLAEQIMFANVKGDVIIHMDSDGFVDKHMVEFVEAQSVCKPVARCLWGQNVFHDDETGARLPHADPRLEHYPKQPGVFRMPKQPLAAHGALWACPTSVIRELGGHNMHGIGYRGQDSRLGQRIQAVCQCDLVTDKRFQFHHYGLPTQYSLLHGFSRKARNSEDRFKAAQDIKKFKETHHMPQLGWVEPLVVNGGRSGWDSYNLSEMYEEIAV